MQPSRVHRIFPQEREHEADAELQMHKKRQIEVVSAWPSLAPTRGGQANFLKLSVLQDQQSIATVDCLVGSHDLTSLQLRSAGPPICGLVLPSLCGNSTGRATVCEDALLLPASLIRT